MKTKVRKWGNSLALRIPKSFASEAGFEQDATVEISLVEGKLILTPILEPATTLEELLSGVTAENIHREIDAGPAVGKEIW